MKYILMMNTMRAGHGVPEWPQKDLQAHIAFMVGLNKELRQSGELVSAEGLSFPDQAKLVRAGKDGLPITDGVFPESKEFLAGYWIVDVDSPFSRLLLRRRCGAGGDDCGVHAMAAGGCSRESTRLVDSGRIPPHDRPR